MQVPAEVVMSGGEDIECSLSAVDVVEVLAGPVHGEPLHPLVLTGQYVLPSSSVPLHLKLCVIDFCIKLFKEASALCTAAQFLSVCKVISISRLKRCNSVN